MTPMYLSLNFYNYQYFVNLVSPSPTAYIYKFFVGLSKKNSYIILFYIVHIYSSHSSACAWNCSLKIEYRVVTVNAKNLVIKYFSY